MQALDLPRSIDPRTLLPPDPPLQLLDERGVRHASEDFPLELTDAALRDLYRLMVVTRAIDRQGITLQRQGQLALYPSLRGQEAAQIGSAYALAERDWVFPSYRELGAALVRGVPPEAILDVFRGTWLSGHDFRERRFGLLAVPIGTQTLHAAGFAMAAKLDGADLVVLCYCGDGATSEGDTHEALNFAAVFQAPVVFLVQNNHFAISVPVSRQTHAPTIAHKGIGYGMPGYRCDGNDVLATYAVTRHAVERARRGDGPSLIEAVTYRMEAHTTADDPRRYRSDEERDAWLPRDPLTRMETFLAGTGLLDDAFRDRVQAEALQRAAAVRTAIFDAPHGDPMELFAHVYVDPPPALGRQAAQLADELARDPQSAAGAAEA